MTSLVIGRRRDHGKPFAQAPMIAASGIRDG
jgi:hypothetical protein